MGGGRAGEAGGKGGGFEGVKVEREGDGKGEEMMQDVDDTNTQPSFTLLPNPLLYLPLTECNWKPGHMGGMCRGYMESWLLPHRSQSLDMHQGRDGWRLALDGEAEETYLIFTSYLASSLGHAGVFKIQHVQDWTHELPTPQALRDKTNLTLFQCVLRHQRVSRSGLYLITV